MVGPILRSHWFHTSDKLTLTNSATTTPEIPFDGFAGGVIFIPAGSAITSLTFFAAPLSSPEQKDFAPAGPTQTFLQLYDNTNTAVSLTVTAGRCYALPTDLFGAGSIKIVIGGVASAVAEVCKKS